MSRIKFVEEGAIPLGTWIEARRLCANIDLKDAPFVALALHLNASLWTKDAELQSGLITGGFDHFFTP